MIITNTIWLLLVATGIVVGYSYHKRKDEKERIPPKIQWEQIGSNGTFKQRVRDYKGQALDIAIIEHGYVVGELMYVMYCNLDMDLNLKVKNWILVQRNGDVFGCSDPKLYKWSEDLWRTTGTMPLVAKLSDQVESCMLDGVANPHHYVRHLTISCLQYSLAVCRLPNEDPSLMPWLLIFCNKDGKRQLLKLVDEKAVVEASRPAMLAVMHQEATIVDPLWRGTAHA